MILKYNTSGIGIQILYPEVLDIDKDNNNQVTEIKDSLTFNHQGSAMTPALFTSHSLFFPKHKKYIIQKEKKQIHYTRITVAIFHIFLT